jgi:Polyketide cyclase / dehydrase and lipid transport
MTTVEVSRDHEYMCRADQLWDVLADPVKAASLDQRTTLISTAGPTGQVGSTYELDAASGLLRTRQRIEVVKAERPAVLEGATTINGRLVAVQTAKIQPTPSGCRVTWTVVITTPRLLASTVRRKAEKELPRWLSAAATVAR